MEKQVAIEIMQMIGQSQVEFDNPVPVIIEPDTQTSLIKRLVIENRDLVVSVADRLISYDTLPGETKLSIGRRLRWILNATL